MKILATSYDFLPNIGGISNCAVSILSSLADEKNEVRLIARSDAPPMPFTLVPIQHHQNTMLAAFKIMKNLFNEVKKDKPDALFHFLWWPGAFSSFVLSFFSKYATPYFIMIHGKEILEKRVGFKSRFRHFLKDCIFSRASGVVSVSDFTASIALSNVPSIQCKIKTIYHGVDTQYYSPSEPKIDIRKKLGLEGKKVFLTVARLESYKGVDYGIMALKRALKVDPDLAYVIVGTGIDFERIKKIISHEGLEKNVFLVGKVPYSELPDYYRMADCFLLLTRNEFLEPNFEGLGIVILEAAASGKPSLVGNDSGMIEAIQHGKFGWGINPNNIDEIEKAMISVMSNKEELLNKGIIAREMTEKFFYWNRTAKELVQFMKKEINSCVE